MEVGLNLNTLHQKGIYCTSTINYGNPLFPFLFFSLVAFTSNSFLTHFPNFDNNTFPIFLLLLPSFLINYR